MVIKQKNLKNFFNCVFLDPVLIFQTEYKEVDNVLSKASS